MTEPAIDVTAAEGPSTMADSPSSSNPFRRKAPPAQLETATVGNGAQVRGGGAMTTARQLPIDLPLAQAVGETNKYTGKPVKHVRVQSPPPSSPEEVTGRRKSETSLPQGHEGFALGHDPFKTGISDDDESDDTDEGISIFKGGAGGDGRVPANPFSKTLATLERTEGKTKLTSDALPAGTGKALMDVDAFQRLLMTGSSSVAVSTPLAQPSVQQPTHTAPTNGSSTEASSVSRHSIFENVQENLPESPRTSHEVSDAEEERRRITSLKRSASERKRPPPPSSRHGKLINMQLRGETRPHSLYLTSTSAPSSILPAAQRSLTDLNKPLPPAPFRASQDSDRESIFDRESAGKAPEPPSPTASLRRKPAPAPPSARRHGHNHAANDPQAPHLPTKRITSAGDESSRNSSTQDLPSLHQSPSQHPSFKIPPPPPSHRRPGSVRNVSAISSPLTTTTTTTTTAMTGAPSTSIFAPPDPLSATSRTSSSKRLSTAHPPPPPPPHNRSRTSLDTAAAELDLGITAARPVVPVSSSANPSPYPSATASASAPASTSASEPEAPKPDILADLTALQREIDALRGRGVA